MWGWFSLLQLKYEVMVTFGSPRAQRNFPLSLISNYEAVAGIEAKTGGALRKQGVQTQVFLKTAA